MSASATGASRRSACPARRDRRRNHRRQRPARPARPDRQPHRICATPATRRSRRSRPAPGPPCWAGSRRCSTCRTPRPSIIDAERLAWKQDYVERVAWCDMGLYVGGTKTNIAAPRRTGDRARRLRHQGVRRQLHRRSAGRGRREPGARDARRTPPHRLSQRGRVPPAGPPPLFKRGDPYARHMEWRDEETRIPRHPPADGAGRARPGARRISCTSRPPRNSTTSRIFATSPRSRCW